MTSIVQRHLLREFYDVLHVCGFVRPISLLYSTLGLQKLYLTFDRPQQCASKEWCVYIEHEYMIGTKHESKVHN